MEKGNLIQMPPDSQSIEGRGVRDSLQDARGVDDKVFWKKFVESEVGDATYVV